MSICCLAVEKHCICDIADAICDVAQTFVCNFASNSFFCSLLVKQIIAHARTHTHTHTHTLLRSIGYGSALQGWRRLQHERGGRGSESGGGRVARGGRRDREAA